VETSVELSVLKLVLGSSMFTKTILLILLSISIASWGILIHKYLFLKKYKDQISLFSRTLASKGNIALMEDTLMPFSKGPAKTLPVIMLKILRFKNQGGAVPSSGAIVNNAAMSEMAKLQKGLGVLATTANVSPLIGLLGTVWGIMFSFINISQQGSASIAVVAPGIAEALVTTIAGLLVAIPAMVGHNFLSVWINGCLDNIDRITEFAISFFADEPIK
jgi:biopolymer transport protein TolQ